MFLELHKWDKMVKLVLPGTFNLVFLQTSQNTLPGGRGHIRTRAGTALREALRQSCSSARGHAALRKARTDC